MNERALDHRTKLGRRRLLGGLGALTVAITSPVWRVATVFGQDANAPAAKRFIGIFSADGTIPAQFFPTANDGSTPLALPRILAPLEKHKSKLLVLRGVHMNSTVQNELGKNITKPGGPHMKGPGAMLTGGSLLEGSFTGAGGPAGYADRISVDQLIAQRVGAATKYPSLELGVRVIGPGPLSVISFRGPNQPNLPVNDPWKVYSRIFANQDLSATELARRLAERKSVLDFLKDDLNRLNTRISADDKRRLDAHLTGIRSIEQGLTNAGPSCSPLQMPAKLNPDTQENYPVIGKLQMDLMLLAHSCDLTRVSTLMWSNANSWQHYPWLGVNEEHHELSHSGSTDAAATEKLVKVAVWHAEQVAYVIERLAALPEVGGGAMLDRTLLLWGNEIGVGNTHTYKDIPWLIAGGAGYFKTGRSLQLNDQPHNNLLLSVCHAMGLTDVQSFGIPALCTGPLPGLVA